MGARKKVECRVQNKTKYLLWELSLRKIGRSRGGEERPKEGKSNKGERINSKKRKGNEFKEVEGSKPERVKGNVLERKPAMNERNIKGGRK